MFFFCKEYLLLNIKYSKYRSYRDLYILPVVVCMCRADNIAKPSQPVVRWKILGMSIPRP